jgi:hypothetical protein
LLDRVDHRVRVSPNRLDVGISPDSDIANIIHLAQREIECCPFFTFTVEIRSEQLVLVIEVPNDAVQVLDDITSEAQPN